jgi:hypothetical protein
VPIAIAGGTLLALHKAHKLPKGAEEKGNYFVDMCIISHPLKFNCSRGGSGLGRLSIQISSQKLTFHISLCKYM